MYEWQLHGDNEWVYGIKTRGIVRRPIAEVYFDEDLEGPLGGWVWMVHSKDSIKRGLALSLDDAVLECESVMGF